MSGASERANGRASGPVLQFVFFAVIDHSALALFFPVFAVESTSLPSNKKAPMTEEQIKARRDEARKLHSEKMRRLQEFQVSFSLFGEITPDGWLDSTDALFVIWANKL